MGNRNNNRGGAQQQSPQKVVPELVNELPAELPPEILVDKSEEVIAEVSPELPPEVPQLPPAIPPLVIDPVFQQALVEHGIQNPEWFVSGIGPSPSPKEKYEVLKYLDAQFAAGKTVMVESLVSNGDYPSRIHRDLGEKFMLDKTADFSFRWMKLVISK